MAQMSRGNRPGLLPISSYILLSLFLTVFLFLGLLNQSTYIGIKKPQYNFPDFDRIATSTRVLSERDVNLDNSNSRIMVIGDVHGMNDSLQELLGRVSYNPSHDYLFFSGDLLAKSSHETSLSVVDFVTKNHKVHGQDRIFPVRGNHDQLVVQWRAWRQWYESLTLPAPTVQSHAPFFFRDSSSLAGRLTSAFYSLCTANVNSSDTVGILKKNDQVPPVSTGREFLQLIEAEWAVEKMKNEPDPEEYAEVARKRAMGTWREAWWLRIPRPGKGRNYQSWRLFTDHYWLARDMTRVQAEYWMSLPLINHVPHLHLFVVHAGILPSDPRLSPTDPRQPLAHPPHIKSPHHSIGYDSERDVDTDGDRDDEFISRLRANMLVLQEQENAMVLTSSPDDTHYIGSRRAPRANLTEDDLRTMQETALLQEVPQNRDPWVVLNIRSVKKKGKVTRNGDKGTPWSEIWNEQMDRCDGFDDIIDSSSADSSSLGDDPDTIAKKKYSLQCQPSTVVYGHAASRGLDIKRWSVGLDTGCLYGRKLTALVLNGSGASDNPGHDDDGEDDDEEDDDDDGNEHGDKEDDEDDDDDDDNDDDNKRESLKEKKKVRFGDRKARIEAKLVSVRCPVVDAQD